MREPTSGLAVGVVGLGAMGGRIARRLLDVGHDVCVWNRTAGRAQALVGSGARRAETPAGVAAGSDLVITMVSDGAALEAVVTRPDGVAAGLRSGAVFVDMSTVGPRAIPAVAQLLPSDAEVIDAPVLGSVAEAEAGELTLFVGATGRGLARATPVLAELGTVLPVGPPGSGAAAKLVANGALLGCVVLVGEMLALTRALGLSDAVGFDVLSTTPLAGQAAKRRPAIQDDKYPPRFRLQLAAKDARLALESTAGGPELPVVRAVSKWLHTAVDAGLGNADYSAVLRYILHDQADTWR
jgi:3-hydroxyisobutyrate dehydrogenase-like beta-hydroxyacid dehydrogenase